MKVMRSPVCIFLLVQLLVVSLLLLLLAVVDTDAFVVVAPPISSVSTSTNIGSNKKKKSLGRDISLVITNYAVIANVPPPPPPPLVPDTHLSGIVPTIATTSTALQYQQQQQQRPVTVGIRSYLQDITSSTTSSPTSATSTMLLSLQDRKIPTKEEVDQKKLTFNLIFWGGGFVAPFIATVFYFGFKFWEK